MDKKSTCKLPARGSNRIQTTKNKGENLLVSSSHQSQKFGMANRSFVWTTDFFQNDHLNHFGVNYYIIPKTWMFRGLKRGMGPLRKNLIIWGNSQPNLRGLVAIQSRPGVPKVSGKPHTSESESFAWSSWESMTETLLRTLGGSWGPMLLGGSWP